MDCFGSQFERIVHRGREVWAAGVSGRSAQSEAWGDGSCAVWLSFAILLVLLTFSYIILKMS